VPILVAAVVLVTALGLLNLLLLLAMLRRLRAYETRLPAAIGGDPQASLLPLGTPLPVFAGATGSGPTGLAVVAFLSTGCDACQTQVPKLRRYLTDHELDRDAALVVVAGEEDDPVGRQYADQLGGSATVVREPQDGPIGRAFGARVYPTFYLVNGGVVRAAGIAVEQLAEPVPA